MAALDPEQYGYIVPATVYIPNHNGKGAVGGHVEFYVAGTASQGSRGTQYTTYANFDGSLNPVRVPIDMDGHFVAIGTFSLRYDVYVYDSYNNLLYSRHNVSAIGSGSGGGSGQSTNVELNSPNNTISIQETMVDNTKTFNIDINSQDEEISWGHYGTNTLEGTQIIDDSFKWAEYFEPHGTKIHWVQVGSDPDYGEIRCDAGIYHYDLCYKVEWEGTVNATIANLMLGGFDTPDRDHWIPFDLSYNHTEFFHFSGINRVVEGYEDQPLTVSKVIYGANAPAGLKISIQYCVIYSLDDVRAIVGRDPSALHEVSHDSSMTGKGTPTEPLSVNFPPIPEAPVQDVLVNGESVVDENGDANIDLSGYAEKSEIPEVPVQDVTYGGTSVVNAQGVAEIPTPPSPPVTDVTVNGVSVVNAQGVAEIPATGLTEVTHDTTMNGKGTPEEPLSVRMEAIITQVTDDIQDAINTLKSRIIYTVGLSSVENTYTHNGNHDSNGVFAKGTLFNPPMDFDLTDDTRIVFSTNQSAGTDTGKLYFAVYQYDASSKEVNWICNTDNCFSYVAQSGYQAGFHFALMSHKKDGVSKLVSGKLYFLVMFTDNTNFKIAGNDYAATINTFNGGTNLGLGAYLDSVKNTGTVSPGATTVINSGSDIETLVPKIAWGGEYLTRVFAAIMNVTEDPFDGLPNNKVPSNTALANTLPGFTAGSANTSYRSVTPSSNVNISAVEWVDCMPTAAAWAKSHFIYDNDYSHLLSGDGSTAIVTDLGQVATVPGAYIHRIVFSTAIPLQAYTEYKFLCECFTAGTDTLFSWNDPKELIQVSNDGYNPALANMQPYSNIIGKYLKVYDDQNNHWVI